MNFLQYHIENDIDLTKQDGYLYIFFKQRQRPSLPLNNCTSNCTCNIDITTTDIINHVFIFITAYQVHCTCITSYFLMNGRPTSVDYIFNV